ncbi:MAG: ribosomal protein S18-alanine N-acetyltransferase [Acidobacteriota bacterium]|nr:ribosomal protein S18-alanine N-acetyltransferase [Acidobacteriota bacterium]
MNIRPATAADVPAMMALESHAVTAAHWSVADYARLFAPGPQTVALVLEEEEVEGFAVARGVGTEWELENIAVAGPAQRRGLGTHLLVELLEWASQAGARNMFLEVRESNHAARSLYEKWAFVESGRRKAYYRNPDEDAVLYRFTFPLITEK